MSKIGEELKKAREAAEKTRAQVAKDTGILIHQLAALEYGNWDSLPDDETVAGFVRKYAEYLGFVPDQPVAEFWAERRGEASDSTEGRRADAGPASQGQKVEAAPDPGALDSTPGPSPTGPRLLGAFALLVVAVVVIGWIMLFNRGGDPLRAANVAPSDPVSAETGDEHSDPTDRDVAELDADDPQATAPDPSEASSLDATSNEPDPATADTESPARSLDPPASETERVDSGDSTSEPAEERDPAPSGASSLTVSEYGVGSGIRDRNLIGRADRFPEGAQVVFWTRVTGGAAGDTVHHVWIREGSEVDDIPLRIGSAHWRTQSRKTLFGGSAGDWAVEARDSEGRVLARSEFTCGD